MKLYFLDSSHVLLHFRDFGAEFSDDFESLELFNVDFLSWFLKFAEAALNFPFEGALSELSCLQDAAIGFSVFANRVDTEVHWGLFVVFGLGLVDTIDLKRLDRAGYGFFVFFFFNFG